MAATPLNSNLLEKYPYLTEGLAMFYAAAEAGNHNAAKQARKIAYSEDVGVSLTNGIDEQTSNNHYVPLKATDKENSLLLAEDTETPKSSERENKNLRYVGNDGIVMRSDPHFRSTQLGVLNEGDTVKFTGKKTESFNQIWAQVEYDGKTGWVKANDLKIEKNSEGEKQNAAQKDPESSKQDMIRYSGEKGVRFYTDATTKSENVALLSLGDEVLFLGEKKKVDNTEWAKVKYNDKVGWVKAEYLKTDKSAVKGNTYEYLNKEMTDADRKAGLKISEKDGEYYYDYTDVVMNRIKEVLPDFKKHEVQYLKDLAKELVKQNNIGMYYSLGKYPIDIFKELLFFYFQVNHEEPWDIKLDEPWKKQFGDINMPYYEGEGKKEQFLFRGELITREDLGNITYGYLGSAMGLDNLILYMGAGFAAEGFEAIKSGDIINPNEYYGDNRRDHDFVKKGIQMYYEDYPE